MNIRKIIMKWFGFADYADLKECEKDYREMCEINRRNHVETFKVQKERDQLRDENKRLKEYNQEQKELYYKKSQEYGKLLKEYTELAMKSLENIELKPCPFCGSDFIVLHKIGEVTKRCHQLFFFVKCHSCGMKTKEESSMTVTNDWNART